MSKDIKRLIRFYNNAEATNLSSKEPVFSPEELDFIKPDEDAAKKVFEEGYKPREPKLLTALQIERVKKTYQIYDRIK